MHDRGQGSPRDKYRPDALQCGADIDVLEEEGGVHEVNGSEGEVVFLQVADIQLEPGQPTGKPVAASAAAECGYAA